MLRSIRKPTIISSSHSSLTEEKEEHFLARVFFYNSFFSYNCWVSSAINDYSLSLSLITTCRSIFVFQFSISANLYDARRLSIDTSIISVNTTSTCVCILRCGCSVSIVLPSHVLHPRTLSIVSKFILQFHNQVLNPLALPIVSKPHNSFSAQIKKTSCV